MLTKEEKTLNEISDLAELLMIGCRNEFKSMGRNELLKIIHDDYGLKILNLCEGTMTPSQAAYRASFKPQTD